MMHRMMSPILDGLKADYFQESEKILLDFVSLIKICHNFLFGGQELL